MNTELIYNILQLTQKKARNGHSTTRKGYLHFTHHLIVYNNAIKKTEAEGAYSQTPQPIL